MPSNRLDAITDVAAMTALTVLSVVGGADPTTATLAIAGLGGYRMRQRSRPPAGGGSQPPQRKAEG